MIVEIHLGYLGVGSFLLGMLFATLGILELLGITKFYSKSVGGPETLLIYAIIIISSNTLFGLGNAISPVMGDILAPLVFIIFMLASIVINRRLRRKQPHNKALNSDAGGAGTG